MTSTHRPRKRFGQNFLQDQAVLAQMVDAINPRPNQHLVEIGPGQGALTQHIEPICPQLDLIEIDRDLVEHLQQHYANHKTLQIHQADVLSFDFNQLIKNGQKLRIVGNLPYNISTPLIFHLFTQISSIEDMHFLLQREIVARITSAVGDSNYGRLSIMVQYFCQPEGLFDVEASAFYPPPKVQSTFIRLIPHKKTSVIAEDFTLFSHVVKQAFSQRRKTVANSLKPFISAQQLNALNIDPKFRPQQLSIEQFVRISNKIGV